MFIKRAILTFIKNNLAGKVKWQRFFNSSKFIVLQGLNFGDGGSIDLSGEIGVIKNLNNRARNEETLVIFDVGANTGYYCDAILQNITAKKFEVWCFEPSGNAFAQLEKKHGTITNVHLHQLGFSNVAGNFPLYSDVPGNVTASLFPLERAFNTDGKLHDFETVTIATIDEFAQQNDIAYIDFLKLDIEGNELNALFGAQKMLAAKLIRSIQFEFGTCNIDSRTYFRDFWNLLHKDYNIYRVIKDGLYPITYYTEYDEIFATINYYAELK